MVALLRALPMLLDVMILCGFAFFIFGIAGVQLFAGLLRHRYFRDRHISCQAANSFRNVKMVSCLGVHIQQISLQRT